MSNLDTKYLTVKKYASYKDYLADSAGVDKEIIEILNFDTGIIKKARSEGFFFMPNYISYIRKTNSFESVLKGLSKNKRKKIRKARDAFESDDSLKIITEKHVSEDSFKEWYNNIYLKNLDEKDYAILIANESWYKEDLDKAQKAGMFVSRNGKIIGGIVGKSFVAGTQFPERMSISYSAFLKDFSQSGFNDYLNACFIDFVYKMGYDWVSRGQDTNFYAKHLSPGIAVFKSALRYEIFPNKNKGDILIKINDFDNLRKEIFFVSYNENLELEGNLIFKTNPDAGKVKMYHNEALKRMNVYCLAGKNELKPFSN